jgi:hypothetical protein
MERILPLFNQGLEEAGYVVGRNVTIESREGDRSRLPALAADLVRQACDGHCCHGSSSGAGSQGGDADHPGRFPDGRRPRRGCPLHPRPG